MLTRVTDTIIEELITLACGELQDPRSRHLLTHALHGLVRVAQSEQLQQMRLDVEMSTGGMNSCPPDISLTAGFGNVSTRPT
jgi:hypothetical protein